MNFLLGYFSEMWRQQVEFEVRRQSVRGSLLALKAVLGSTRRVVLFTLYVLVFLYAFFGLLTVAITAPDLSLETKPLVIYGLIAGVFGGLLVYNLREETWIKRWGIRERIEALRLQSESAPEPAAQSPEVMAAQELKALLERFEDRMEARLESFERKQARRIESGLKNARTRSQQRRNGTTEDLALY